MKTIIAVFVSIAVIFGFAPASAAPTRGPLVDGLPAGAVEISPNVYDLGLAKDPSTGKTVQGLAIVHKKSPPAKGNSKKGGGSGPTCYGYLASGAKWKTVEDWEVFAGAGLDGSWLLSRIAGDIDKWEEAADYNILGNGSIGSGTPADVSTLDEKNQVSFGNLGDEGTIAVTYVWGYFYGPPRSRQLVEWDQIYNTQYEWSDSGEAGKMDFENIATHELGHSAGLDDIYDAGCSEVTMYGYGVEGETKKRDLAQPDITGVANLY